jgi:hypothetical protein
MIKFSLENPGSLFAKSVSVLLCPRANAWSPVHLGGGLFDDGVNTFMRTLR